jgi:GAF domain-containing protein
MAALAIRPTLQPLYYFQLQSDAETNPGFAQVLDQTASRAGAQVAVLYRVNPETREFTAVSVRSELTSRIGQTGLTFNAAASQWIETLAAPEQGRPDRDAHFEKFPEGLQYRLESILAVPLRTSDDRGELLGLLTLGRSGGLDSFGEEDIQYAENAAVLLNAVLERDFLRRKLEERKLVERAKGILQRQHRLTEEQAYLSLRNASRSKRVPMLELARQIIDAFIPGMASQPRKTA